MSEFQSGAGDKSVVKMSDAPGQGMTAGGPLSGERWANLPPELRAIKDRWLGESNEGVGFLSTANGANVSTLAASSTPTRADKLDKDERSETDRCENDVSLEGLYSSVGKPTINDVEGRGARGKGMLPSETTGEEEKEEERPGRRCITCTCDSRGACVGCSEDSLTLRNMTGDIPDAKGLDMLQEEQLPEADDYRIRHQHPSPCTGATAARPDSRHSRSGRDASSPQPGQGPLSAASGTRERAGELARKKAMPEIPEGLGVPLAPAFGDALGDPEDTQRRERARSQLRALRSRLPRSATGGIPPAVSPTLLRGDRKPAPSSQEENPAGAQVQPPSAVGAQVDVHKNRDGQGRHRQSSSDRRGAGGGGRARHREERHEAAVCPVTAHIAYGGTAGSKLQLGGAWSADAEGAGVGIKPQKVATVGDGVAVAAERVPVGCTGAKSTSESPSTSSRPSELFDSLDLSASPLRSGGVLATAVPASAKPAQTTVGVTYPQRTPHVVKELENAENPKRAVVTTAAPALEVPPPTAPQDGPPDKAAPVWAITAVRRSRTNQASQGTPTKLWMPEIAPESPPTALPKAAKAKPREKSDHKNLDAPNFSRLRAPGWGRETKITAIPPASTAAGGANTGPPHDAPAAATNAALLPLDLLTPVTEAATADEHSAVSRSTRGTARMTPASSESSGPGPGQGEGIGGMRSRFHHKRPQCAQATPRRHAAAGPGAAGGRLESAVEPSGPGVGHGREKRATWGSAVVGSGAHSAPGKSTARPKRAHSPSGGGALSSQTGSYRSSPLSGAGDRIGARGSTFSSASEEVRPRGQAAAGGGGYVAAMGRRARSRARCEEARRVALAALAAKRTRPSTPISERARWGKGRENQAEVARRKLLQRRAQYAEELQRKAKEDAAALARRNIMAASPAMLPADHRHVRASTLEHNSPGCDADALPGAREGSTPRAVDARTNHVRARFDSRVDSRADAPRGPHVRPALSLPAPVNGQGRGGQGIDSAGRAARVGVGGCERGVARRRQKPERQAGSDRQSTAVGEEEEERLMASIARLDTLLRKEEGGDTGAKASRKASESPGGGMGLRTDQQKRGREAERKPVARAPAGGIAISRVRKGGGKETKACRSLGMASTMGAKVGQNHGISEPAVSGVANEHAATGAVPSGAGMFPPLFSRVPPCPAERRDWGRYAPPEGDGMLTNSPPTEAATSRVPASHVPGARHGNGHEQRWTGRRDDVPGEAMPVQNHRSHNENSREAVMTRRAGGSSSRGGGLARENEATRQEEWAQRTPCSPGLHRDARHGDSYEGWNGYNGRGQEYYGQRVSSADPRDVWDIRAERRGWAGESPPEDQSAYGQCRGVASREWDRREDGRQYLPTYAARW
eukprot:g20123.t1